MSRRPRWAQVRQEAGITPSHHAISAADHSFNQGDRRTEVIEWQDDEDSYISRIVQDEEQPVEDSCCDDRSVSEDSLSISSMASRTKHKKLSDTQFRGELDKAGSRLANLLREPPDNLDSVRDWLDRAPDTSDLDPTAWGDIQNSIRKQHEPGVKQFIAVEILPIKQYQKHHELFLSCEVLWVYLQPLTELLGQVAPDYALGLTRKAIFDRFPGLAQQYDLIDGLQMTEEQFLVTLTAEAKGPSGTENRAVLQVLHNGTLMIKRRELLDKKLKRKRRHNDNQVLALSIVLTHQDIAVWGHWKVTEGKGKMSKTICLSSRLAATHLENIERALQLAMNAFEWSADQSLNKVMRDLELLELKSNRKG